MNKTSRKYRQYIGIFFASVCIPLFGVGLFNIIIDPYGVFNQEDIPGINHAKVNQDNNDRLAKATDITRIKPITLLLGSSRTKQGLDPDHPQIVKDQPAYNVAINGPNMYEVKRYLDHAIANQENLQTVILGVDFFMFNANLDNQPSFSDARLGKRHLIIQDFINIVFSIDAFYASKETLLESGKEAYQNDNYGENGFQPNRQANDGNTKWRFGQSIKLYFELHSDYDFSSKYFANFEEVVKLCQKHNIDLKVFISPAHATQWESIRSTGRWPVFEEWKRKLVAVTPVWDFSGYNSITRENIRDEMNNYSDNSHYTKPVGDLILNRIFSYQEENIPEDFGILLTPENIDSHLAKIRADRENWLKENPEELKLVKTLQQEQKAEQNAQK
ncbi:MAG: hypothetical protein WBG70_00080 [Spirulinaceae cyanobacterium]